MKALRIRATRIADHVYLKDGTMLIRSGNTIIEVSPQRPWPCYVSFVTADTAISYLRRFSDDQVAQRSLLDQRHRRHPVAAEGIRKT
jgi:hypothetical protein